MGVPNIHMMTIVMKNLMVNMELLQETHMKSMGLHQEMCMKAMVLHPKVLMMIMEHLNIKHQTAMKVPHLQVTVLQVTMEHGQHLRMVTKEAISTRFYSGCAKKGCH